MNVELNIDSVGVLIATLSIRPVLKERIQEAQPNDPKLMDIIEKVKQGEETPFTLQDDTLMLGDRICVPDTNDLRREILDEAHKASYVMHPDNTMKPHYWWP